MGLPYTFTGRLQIPTRAPRQILWVAGVWRLEWTARALDRLLIRCSAPIMEDNVIGSAHRRFRVFVVRCCVTAELVDFDCDSRTDGLVYKAALFFHFRPSFLEFLRISKTLLWNSQETLKARNTDNNARHNRRSPSEFGAEQHLCKRPSALAVLTGPD